MRDNIDIEAELRDSLSEHARHAPAAGLLAERIIHQAELAPPARKRHWRTWTLPLIAAGSVATVAAAMFGITQIRHSADHRPPAIPATSPVPTPTPTVQGTTPPPGGPSSTAKQTNPAVLAPVPANFTTLDLTFVSADESWALGSGDCLSGPGRCTALLRTTDGGSTWNGASTPPANVEGVNGCAEPCIQHVRFADARIGYTYGPAAFFMTTDGGIHWTRQPGGADALETLDGNVIRVVDDHSGCPGPCNVRVQTAAIGAHDWKAVTLPGAPLDAGMVQLTRTGKQALLALYSGQAGHAQPARVFVSPDDGHAWTAMGDPCPTSGRTGSFANTSVTSSVDGSFELACTGVGNTAGSQFIGVLTGGAARLHAGPSADRGVDPIGAASATVVFGFGDRGLYRSSNGGGTWTFAVADHSNGTIHAPGFQSATTGRWVSADGRTIWTTRDAGLTWTAHTFH